MKYKMLLLGVTVAAATLALAGVLRDVSTSKALMPLPVQPYWPDEVGGLSSTQLDQPVENYAVSNVTRGQRRGESVVYYAPGFQVAEDAEIDDGTVVGSVMSSLDVICDSTGPSDVEICAQASSLPPDYVPYDWQERATAVEGTPEEYLKETMPPFPWLLRLRADMDTIWLMGTYGYPFDDVLNTVYASVPWSPNQDALAATTRGRWPGGYLWILHASWCLDSPQSSTSITSTTVWTNPALEGDTDEDGIDDATGLYPRWTAFQSDPDDRKPFQNPPSIASDTGYVERIVDLQCFWLDEDGCYTDEDNTTSCDEAGDGNGYVDEVESWTDYDIPAGADDDGDCLIDPAYAQPGQPVDLPTAAGQCDAAAGWVEYSAAPTQAGAVNSKAADHDCDGLKDGIEVAWGSNPMLADGDNDGATDFVEMFQDTNPVNPDSDGDGIKDKPEDDYQGAAYGSAETGEAANLDDNCPTVYNADQANADGQRRDNGNIVNVASNPNQDKMGDACDPDDDNDNLPDAYENTIGSNPTALDSDGDTINDGAEVTYMTNPMSNTSFPVWTAAVQQVYYRGCHHNLPTEGTYPLWDAEYDGTNDDIEMDIDGDGIICGGGGDLDSDNGTGTGAAGPVGYADKVEAWRYGLAIANPDSDGDGCPDWVETTDLDGNRKSDINDVFIVAAKAFPATPVTDAGTLARDLDANLQVAINDVFAAALNSALVRSGATCTTGEQ